MTYATEEDIEATLGYSITTESLPTSSQVSKMLERADAIINAEMHTSTNITDSIGYLKAIACNLVYKMVNNMLAMIKPDEFGPMEISLSEEEKRMIKLAYQKWAMRSFEIGD